MFFVSKSRQFRTFSFSKVDTGTIILYLTFSKVDIATIFC